MFKQLLYKVVYKENEEIKIAPVRRLWLNEMSAYQADIERPKGDENKELLSITVDFVNTFIQEATSQFDKNGVHLFSGDIFKSQKSSIHELKDRADIPDDIFFQIAFVDGSFIGMSMKHEVYIPLNQSIAKISEKAGDIYKTPELVEVKPDETVFQKDNEKTQ